MIKVCVSCVLWQKYLPFLFSVTSLQRNQDFALVERVDLVLGVKVVGLPGFEPGSRTPEAHSLDQTSRQPLSLRLQLHYI